MLNDNPNIPCTRIDQSVLDKASPAMPLVLNQLRTLEIRSLKADILYFAFPRLKTLIYQGPNLRSFQSNEIWWRFATCFIHELNIKRLDELLESIAELEVETKDEPFNKAAPKPRKASILRVSAT